jgi:hypothetical protein
MEPRPIWLSTSLFCNKDHWNDVLTNGIKPFLDQNTHNNQVNLYEIALNYSGGDNIRLALRTQYANAVELAKQTDGYFKNFFLQKNYPGEENQFFNSLFMPFPVNTIQYGLYKTGIEDDRIYQFTKVLSGLLLNTLPDEAIDEQQLLLFAFYLHIIYINSLAKNNYIPDLSSLYQQQLQNKEVSITENTVAEAYEDNKEVLQEIKTDISTANGLSAYQISGFADWIKLCATDITGTISNNEKYNPVLYPNFLQTFYLINKQLGITDNMAVMLLYFIKQVSSSNSLNVLKTF